MKYLIRIILSFLTLIVAIFFIIAIVFVYKNSQGETPYLFGYTAYVNTSTSMLPKIKEGDLVIVKKHDDYKVNDVISFMSSDNLIITHRIVAINDGLYDTKGDNNTFIDGEKVNKLNVYGKMVKTVPGFGDAITFAYKYKYLIVGGLFFLAIAFVGVRIGMKYVRKSNS